MTAQSVINKLFLTTACTGVNALRIKSLSSALIMIISSGVSNAAIVTMDMEGIGDNAKVLNFYNGGTDGQGHSGPNYGVYFSNTAYGSISNLAGGVGWFTNAPSGRTIIGPSGSSYFAMDVTNGFTNQLSFFYSSHSDIQVTLYEGIDGSGNTLASTSDRTNWNTNCTPPGGIDACHWDSVTLNFSGTAKSVIFTGIGSGTGFDNITISTAVPEPDEWAMIMLGFGLVGYQIKRRKKTLV